MGLGLISSSETMFHIFLDKYTRKGYCKKNMKPFNLHGIADLDRVLAMTQRVRIGLLITLV